ncbi:MAG: hypothetical protein M3Y88_02835 [Chloroflexota bacterium]|nr:hypothetical protein [Chloroflexota bacterium]
MTQQRRDPGYRGALPPRRDRLARPWVVTVIALFVLIFVLAFAGIPSRLIPQQTPAPIPSIPIPSASGLGSGLPSRSP